MPDDLAARRRKPLIPCGSTTMSVLGVAEPTRVWCNQLRGHDGRHVHHIDWTDADAVIEQGDGSLVDASGHVWKEPQR